MAAASRAPTSYTAASTSYSTSGTLRPTTSSQHRGRPRTAASTIAGDQQIICAIAESRGYPPVVGIAFVNLSTAEASVCQISDNQTYERTIQKLQVYDPTEVLVAQTNNNVKSRLNSLLETQVDTRATPLDRKFWAENVGIDYVQQLAFLEDVEAIKVSISGNYFAVCCLAAVGIGRA